MHCPSQKISLRRFHGIFWSNVNLAFSGIEDEFRFLLFEKAIHASRYTHFGGLCAFVTFFSCGLDLNQAQRFWKLNGALQSRARILFKMLQVFWL